MIGHIYGVTAHTPMGNNLFDHENSKKKGEKKEKKRKKKGRKKNSFFWSRIQGTEFSRVCLCMVLIFDVVDVHYSIHKCFTPHSLCVKQEKK